MSERPSNPIPGLTYHTGDIERGLEHLALFGVDYYVSVTPEATEAVCDKLLDGFGGNPRGTLTEFYFENSYGQFVVQVDVFDRRRVDGALDDVRARGLRVTARCPFIAAYIRRHETLYGDLLAAPEGKGGDSG